MKPIYKIGNRKVVIIGAGFVGSSIAYALALRDIAREIVLIYIDKDYEVRNQFYKTVLYKRMYFDCIQSCRYSDSKSY